MEITIKPLILYKNETYQLLEEIIKDLPGGFYDKSNVLPSLSKFNELSKDIILSFEITAPPGEYVIDVHLDNYPTFTFEASLFPYYFSLSQYPKDSLNIKVYSLDRTALLYERSFATKNFASILLPSIILSDYVLKEILITDMLSSSAPPSKTTLGTYDTKKLYLENIEDITKRTHYSFSGVAGSTFEDYYIDILFDIFKALLGLLSGVDSFSFTNYIILILQNFLSSIIELDDSLNFYPIVSWFDPWLMPWNTIGSGLYSHAINRLEDNTLIIKITVAKSLLNRFFTRNINLFDFTSSYPGYFVYEENDNFNFEFYVSYEDFFSGSIRTIYIEEEEGKLVLKVINYASEETPILFGHSISPNPTTYIPSIISDKYYFHIIGPNISSSKYLDTPSSVEISPALARLDYINIENRHSIYPLFFTVKDSWGDLIPHPLLDRFIFQRNQNQYRGITIIIHISEYIYMYGTPHFFSRILDVLKRLEDEVLNCFGINLMLNFISLDGYGYDNKITRIGTLISIKEFYWDSGGGEIPS